MRFKLFYNENECRLDINCLGDNFTDVILPENLDQHVYFPIPSDLAKEIQKDLLAMIEEDDSIELEEFRQQMMAIVEERKKLVHKLRAKYNPMIIEKCKEFREENAEYFI